jgi:hypothetical protein
MATPSRSLPVFPGMLLPSQAPTITDTPDATQQHIPA